ncbi:MAG: transposase [Granulosicoccus sp.]
MYDRSSEEYKKAIVKEMASSNLSGRQCAIEQGVALATLHRLKIKYRCDSIDQEKAKVVASDNWSLEEKFAVVLETVSLLEIELGEYCGRKGIYLEQVSVWKNACIQGNLKNSDHKRKAGSDAKADKKPIKELE